ncbi:MAG: hypothetical protein ACYDHP_10095 [Ferrimicrobium sp.]
MLASALTGIRLTVHVLAATIWVGGQLSLAGLVPTIRRVSPEATRAIATQFARISWPAYAVLILTGLWNVSTLSLGRQSVAWQVVLGVKIVVALFAGLAAYIHQRSKSRRALAIWGSISGISAIAALTLGVFLAG